MNGCEVYKGLFNAWHDCIVLLLVMGYQEICVHKHPHVMPDWFCNTNCNIPNTPEVVFVPVEDGKKEVRQVVSLTYIWTHSLL